MDATRLLPMVSWTPKPEFNIFDVMHHGSHEKQLSNVFAWLLDACGTHGLGDRFLRIFIAAVNQRRGELDPLPCGTYAITQEVNTVDSKAGGDLADLVLRLDLVSGSDKAQSVIVVENYHTSDGHGHSFQGYLAYSQRHALQGAVVLLCLRIERELLVNGWEDALVIPYHQLLDELIADSRDDEAYRERHRDAWTMIDHLHRKFGSRGQRMQDQHILEFVTTMCETGDAARYRDQDQKRATEQFAKDLTSQATAHFDAGRVVLNRLKHDLKRFCNEHLMTQLNAVLGQGTVADISANYKGIYQWSINFAIADGTQQVEEAALQIKFGPSAWFANERDVSWKIKVPGQADYTHLFLTRNSTAQIHQSTVTMQEVLGGLKPGDNRLRDEIVGILRYTS